MFKKITQGLSISLLIIYASAAEAKRVALIVGNAAYKNENVLSNPINDARLIAKTLQNDLGFDDVKIIENADLRSLNRAVDEFGRKANGADAAFVYFSGHGLQTTDKQNYLLAVDAQIEQESDLKVSAITSEALVAATEGAKIRLVVLDACRDRPNSVYKTKSATKGLTRAKDPSINGLLIAYATEDGKVAQDGRSGGNSPYAAALVAELKKRDKPIMAMFDEVMESVVKQTNGAQNPTRSGNLTVKVYLVDPIIMPVIAPVAVDSEKEFWDEIKNSRNVKDFKAYKQQFPKGRFVPLADNRIEELGQANTPAVSNALVIPASEQRALNSPNFIQELQTFLKADKSAISTLRSQIAAGSVLAKARFCELSMDEEGYKTPLRPKDGMDYCLDLAAAGVAVGQTNMGWIYDKGKGVTQDYTKAVEWYRKAAEQGYANAQSNLGYMYSQGKGVTQDKAKAVEWYRKAAEQGYATGQNRLGVVYQDGKGVIQDYAKAVEWYRKAAEQGNASGQSNLGRMYDDGKGVTEDDTKAVEWYRKAAEQGNATAQTWLGFMYDEGKGVTEDDTKAVEWYRKAAEQGNADAQRNLGMKYTTGKGITEDYTKAAEWYRKAAEQGDANAQYFLGLGYYNGKGVTQDKTKAIEWICKAAAQNDDFAKKRLTTLNATCPSTK